METDLIEEDDIYSDEKRNALVEDDQISAIEQAFMEGYEDA